MGLADWHDLAIAVAGAVAALTGLVFVALSINLAKILEYPGLVGRAAEALVSLLQPLFVAFAVLMPGQSVRAAGVEVLVLSVITSGIILMILFTSGRRAARGRPRHEFATRCLLVSVAFVPTLVGAVVLCSSSTSGMYWLTAGVVSSVSVGIADAWILLVEIVR